MYIYVLIYAYIFVFMYISIHLSESQGNIHINAIFSLHSTFPPSVNVLKTDWSKFFCPLASLMKDLDSEFLGAFFHFVHK